MTIRNKPRDAAVFGIDLGKNVLATCVLDAAGAPDETRHVPARHAHAASRACSAWISGAWKHAGHAMAGAQTEGDRTRCSRAGEVVREALREEQQRRNRCGGDCRGGVAADHAVRRGASAEQVDLQALHRVRDRLVAQRTRVICQMRAFCLKIRDRDA